VLYSRTHLVQRLAVPDRYGRIILWDVATLEPRGVRMTNPDNSPFLSLAFSPDGSTLASGTFGSVMLWDASTQQLIGNPLEWGNPVTSLSFTPDGRALASADGEQVVLWDLDARSWIERACAIANRNLTEAEWTAFMEEPYRPTCTGQKANG